MQPTPNKGKFQFYATTEAAAEKAPSWLPRPSRITNDNLTANTKNLENKAAGARAEAKRAPPDKQAAATEAAEAATEGGEEDGTISVEDDVVDADFEVVDED